MSADAVLSLAVAVIGVLAVVLEHVAPRRTKTQEALEDHGKRLDALEAWRGS